MCMGSIWQSCISPTERNKSKYVTYTHSPSYKYTDWMMLQQHFVKYLYSRKIAGNLYQEQMVGSLLV